MLCLDGKYLKMWVYVVFCFCFKQKTAYAMRISDWSSDVCSSDLGAQSCKERRWPAMTFAASLLAMLTFLVTFWALGLAPAGAAAVTKTHDTIVLLRDASLSDGARERFARQAFVVLLATCVSIAIRCSGVFVLSFGVILGADRLGLANLHEVLALLLRWELIVATLVLVPLGYSIVVALRKDRKSTRLNSSH